MKDETVEQLIRLVGPRPMPSVEATTRVKAIVREAWRAKVRQRARRRAWLFGLAAAAGVALAIGSLSWRRPAVSVGVVEVADSPKHKAGDPILTGLDVVTGPGARLALRLTGGVSVRLDERTRLRFVAASRLSLARGAVYLDTGAVGRGIEVATAFGVARDVGTRFEVRVAERTLRIRVREGIVTLDDTQLAQAGEELTVDGAGVKRGRISPHGSAWDWTVRVAPPFTLEGQSLRAFLEWAAREQGWRLRFAAPELERASDGTVLHGSIEGLKPEEALPAVLATSGLAHRVADGDLVIDREER